MDEEFSKTFHRPDIKQGYPELVPKRQEQNQKNGTANLITVSVGGVDGIPDHRPAGKLQVSPFRGIQIHLFINTLLLLLRRAARTGGPAHVFGAKRKRLCANPSRAAQNPLRAYFLFGRRQNRKGPRFPLPQKKGRCGPARESRAGRGSRQPGNRSRVFNLLNKK